MKNEIVPKTANSVAQYTGSAPEVLRSDIILPYVALAQGTSDAVKDRKAQIGDIYKTTSLQKLGDPDMPLEVIFFHYPKANWIIENKEPKSDRFQYHSTIPRTAENETLPWYYWADEDGNEVPEGTKGALEWRRVKQMLVFAILPSDLEAFEAEMKKVEQGELPDPTKAVTPVLFSFRGMSYRAGKDVATLFTQCDTYKVPIWKYKVKVGCYLDKNDDGSFYVWQVDRSKATPVPKAQLETVENWAKLVNSAAVKEFQVDNEGEAQSYGAAPVDVGPAASTSAKAEVC
jgi:hypothetical protein